ncbi:MAG: DNA repair protein RecN [Opitutales bacterium]|jgi:DNA repair protein RecN (Recombination protein N)
MLHTLRIENLALMDSVSLEFEKGFTAVTGETGAGKSVLLGALSLLSGSRADKTMIRQGTDTCTLEAAFSIEDPEHLNAHLEDMGLPLTEDGQLIVRRILSSTKASRIWINGAMATLAQLQETGKRWIDFHGPGEPQKLFHEREQLALLDLYAGLGKDLAGYGDQYRGWRSCLEEIERLRNETRLSPEEAEFLRTQIREIDALELSEDRISQLEQDYRRIESAQDLQDLCAQLDEAFLGAKGICQRLQAVLPLAQKLSRLDPSAATLTDRVESLVIEASDLSGEWRALAFETDYDPQQIKQIESSMEAWMNLRRRYGPTMEGVLSKREQMAQRLSIQGDIEGTLQSLQDKADVMEGRVMEAAAGLRSARLKAAHKLAREAENLMAGLGFKKPRLGIEIIARNRLGPTGDADCRMTFAPNPGSDPLPLNKIASSGEMARVMLALKSVLATVDATPVLVFDEVDSNIGGEVATAVARLLADLGKNHQVFCITHLPQVASVAKNHYVVEKLQSDDATRITIECLDHDADARVDEFARMLGDRGSDAARQHARELLTRKSS